MGFTLIQEEILYKRVVTESADGEIIDGVYYEGAAPVITYQEFEGDWEPVSRGYMTSVLPQGLQSSYAIQLMTAEELDVATDLASPNFKEGSVIYLKDPETDTSAVPFDVFDKEDWHKNGGFKLLDGHNTYVCIRREKQ